MKLMIATPANAGLVNIQYCISYSNTVNLLNQNGIEVAPLIVKSGSLLVAERNRLIEAFWQSDCTHVLCIDADLGWPAEAVLAMLQQNKEFVAGVYPARGGDHAYLYRPIADETGRIKTENHLLAAEYIPAGFMLISKPAIEKMREKLPHLYYEPKIKSPENPPPGYCFFNTEIYEGEFWGEDYTFCRNARQAGVEIWVDPLIQFDHAGTIGALIQALEIKPNEETQQTISEAA